MLRISSKATALLGGAGLWALLALAPALGQEVGPSLGAGGGGGGSGTVTTLIAAPGVSCTPNPITTTGACGMTEALGNAGAPITGTTYVVNLSNSEPSDLAKELVFTGTSQLNATLGAGAAGQGFDAYNQSNTVAMVITVTGNIFYCHNGTCGSSGTLGLSPGQFANIFYDPTISGWRASLFDEAGTSTGTVNSGVANSVAYYAANGTAVSDGGAGVIQVNGINLGSAGGGTPTNGWFSCGTNLPCLYAAGTNRFQCNATNCTVIDSLTMNATSSAQINNSASSATNPTVVPNKSGTASGLGGALNIPAIVVSAASITNWNTTGMAMVAGVFTLKNFTVATLPAGPATGSEAYITDAVACTFLGALTGGGSAFCPVIYNGTAWVGH